MLPFCVWEKERTPHQSASLTAVSPAGSVRAKRVPLAHSALKGKPRPSFRQPVIYTNALFRLKSGNFRFQSAHIPVEGFRYPVQIFQILYQFTDHIIYGGSAGGAFVNDL